MFRAGTIDESILGGRPIAFRSTADGRVRGTVPVTQRYWGIKPYRGMMGALMVRDTIEIVLDVPLPSN